MKCNILALKYAKLKNILLIPVPLSTDIGIYFPPQELELVRDITCFVVENAKQARFWLKQLDLSHSLQELNLISLETDSTKVDIHAIFKQLEHIETIGLLSDAGLPCIADPGAQVVAEAHKRNISIIPLQGSNSMIIALMCSGLNGQQFTFHGYLPAKKEILEQELMLIQKELKKHHTSHIFMETPYRNVQLFESVKRFIAPDVYLCVACGIHSKQQWIKTKQLKDWTIQEIQVIHKIPSVFVLGYPA